MREILFRGKRIDNGEWIKGNLAAYDLIAPNYPEDTINATGEYCGQTPYVGFVEVIPETVGQYTGLCDKNGKRIFEGDRIEIRGYVYYCCWDEGNLEYILINEKESFGMGYAASSRMTVIGNIHDNPELLEVDDGESNL